MTNAQEKAIKKIERLTKDLHYSDKYETKTFEIKDCGHFISVFVVVGRVGDEGTLAEVFCRDSVHLFIGKHGGITYPVSKQKKDGSWKHYTKKFGGYNLLQVAIDQRI